jgi:16S rRNA (adenine1518-N6/adenine1519-N6)-dimethyltransferase
MMSLRSQLRELDIHPRKSLGQNFLVARGVLNQILAVAEVGAGDQVLEIGPGLGTLTRALAEYARRVVAVEVDRALVSALGEQLRDCTNVEIVAGDILTLNVTALIQQGTQDCPAADRRYKVVANIPYNITSAVLRHLLEAEMRPDLIVLMVQKEVAQRITAQAGEMSLLSVSVQFYGLPRLMHHVPAGAFYPVPKVDSAIIRIDPHPELPLPDEQIEPFFRVVRAGFGQRRKQLRNSLAGGLGLSAIAVEQMMRQAGIAPERRAQTLTIDEWINLYQAQGQRWAAGKS